MSQKDKKHEQSQDQTDFIHSLENKTTTCHPSAGKINQLHPLTDLFSCHVSSILRLHSAGPDKRWALHITLHPIYSIMTQRKRVTEGREEEWRELRKKCKSRTVGCEFMANVEAYSVSLAAELVLVVERLNLAIPCVPVAGGWGGERNHHEVAASPTPFSF